MCVDSMQEMFIVCKLHLPSLVPRPHPHKEGRSGARSRNSWTVPQNEAEEAPIKTQKDYTVIAFAMYN